MVNYTISTPLLLDRITNNHDVIKFILIEPVIDIIYESNFVIENIGRIAIGRVVIKYDDSHDLKTYCGQAIDNLIQEFSIPEDKFVVVVEEY